ncbi:alpha/beta hydrolase family protein [bacterium]|jgi:dienelactone hydrolase|nr:alpha/beta hydrolase family protein [bacterium]
MMFHGVAIIGLIILGAGTQTHPESHTESVGTQKVVHLVGSPREMGLAQGRLMQQEIADNVRLLVHEHAVKDHQISLEALDKEAAEQVGAWPASLQQELEGLAEGSKVPLADIKRLQVALRPIASRSGAGYAGRTLGGRLLQVLSVEPGHPLPARAMLAVYHRPEGIRYASVTLAGYLGTLAGLNEEGISITTLPVPSSDRSDAGLAAPHLARVILESSKTLPAVRTAVDQSPRSGSWIIIAGDGKVPNARVLEVNAQHVAEFGSNDTAEKLAPFRALADLVRRSNRFVSAKLAESTDIKLPWVERSADRYAELSDMFEKPMEKPGSLDLLAVLRKTTASHVPQSIVIINASEQVLWMGFGGTSPNGAADQEVVGYPLTSLLSGKDVAATARVDSPAHPLDPTQDRLLSTTISPTRTTSFEADIPAMYQFPSDSFTYQAAPDAVGSGIVRTLVKIPSPVVTPYPENNTIPVEVFKPRSAGPYPYVIITHIAGGDFELSRFVASTLANAGIACTFVKLPYYGERRPPGKNVKMLQPDVEVASTAMVQAVKDLRRVVDWIDAQPDLDRHRIGICGISLGSITGSLAAGIEPRLTHACLIIGGGNLHDLVFESVEGEAREFRRLWTEQGGTRESLGKLMHDFDPVSYSDRLRERTVLMINASQDESVPVVCGKALWEAAGKQRIIWYPCGHYTIVRYIMPALQHTVKFFKDWPSREENVASKE